MVDCSGGYGQASWPESDRYATESGTVAGCVSQGKVLLPPAKYSTLMLSGSRSGVSYPEKAQGTLGRALPASTPQIIPHPVRLESAREIVMPGDRQ